jgi:hypothetical protein
VKYSFRTALKLPGVIFARTAATQKLSTIYMDPVPGLRKFRPEPTKPYVCATYVSISATCPNSCVFKDNGCFAQNGFIRRITRPLDEQVKEAQITGLEVAKNEASLMDRAFAGRWARHHNRIPRDGARGGRDLRLHVGGDVSGSDAVVVLAAAARRWIKRGGGDVWTYTHRWRDIPVELWGPIRVWASTETVAEALEAKSLGYRASMTLDQGFSIRGSQRKGPGRGDSVSLGDPSCAVQPLQAMPPGEHPGQSRDRLQGARQRGQRRARRIQSRGA